MQFNRKYYLMLVILSLLAVLIVQGDSDLFHSIQGKKSQYTETANRKITPDEAQIILESEVPQEVCINEDIFIEESKNWIINKESILGY